MKRLLLLALLCPGLLACHPNAPVPEPAAPRSARWPARGAPRERRRVVSETQSPVGRQPAPLAATAPQTSTQPRAWLPAMSAAPVFLNIQVGDPAVNYANVEFTADNRYMVWFEKTDVQGNGKVWHCGVDPDTGDLIPPDGKGFAAFESTVLGRANPGLDENGPYYVGMDRTGQMLLVRPTSPFSGVISSLSTPPDLTRRAIYPTILSGQSGGFVFWIKNEAVPGGGTNPANNWFELQYIVLHDPTQVHVVERQARPQRGFAPMDSAFARWMKNKPALTYGFDDNGVVQVRMLDLTQPNPAPEAVTNDPGNKVDPYSWLHAGREILLPGINAEARTHVYTRSGATGMFSLTETIIPPASGLQHPALAQSNEPIVFDGRAYTVYQINEAGADFWDVTFDKPGEIWLSTLFESPQQQWRLTDSQTAKAEPEPFVGNAQVWVFYNVIEGSNPMTARWHLYRAKTPIRRAPGLPAGDITRTLTHAGRERRYILHVPESLDRRQPAALVFVFHGGSGNAESAIHMTQFNQVADQHGFLVVYPNGTGALSSDTLLTWNGGACCAYAQANNVDDVGFARAMVADLQTLIPIDRRRVYAAGMSNGGLLSHRLGCEAADLFAAIAPVAGTLNFSPCVPTRPVSVIMFHGTADEHLPYNGGVGPKSFVGVDFASVQESVELWTAFDGCSPEPQTAAFDDIQHRAWRNCAGGAEVELYTIVGGGHAWPGGNSSGRPGADQPTQTISASQLIWEFFAAHARP